MKTWTVDKDFIIDFNEAPAWATKVAWRRRIDGALLRVWMDEHNTMYQYLRGFSGGFLDYTVYTGNFLTLEFANSANIIARLDEPTPMVCHDQFGFMTDEFRDYSQQGYDTIRKQVEEMIRAAIWSGVSPIAMKEVLNCAVDCGVTMAMAEMKVKRAEND